MIVLYSSTVSLTLPAGRATAVLINHSSLAGSTLSPPDSISKPSAFPQARGWPAWQGPGGSSLGVHPQLANSGHNSLLVGIDADHDPGRWVLQAHAREPEHGRPIATDNTRF